MTSWISCFSFSFPRWATDWAPRFTIAFAMLDVPVVDVRELGLGRLQVGEVMI